MPNYNTTTGIPFGVHAGSHFADLVHDIQVEGDSISRREAVEEIRASVARIVADLPVHNADAVIDDATDEIVDACEFEFDEESFEYEGAEASYLLGHLGGAHLLWVVSGKWAMRCRACSPCVPGAGDLDSPCADDEGPWAHCLAPGEYRNAFSHGYTNIPHFIYPITNNEIVADKPFDLWTFCGKASE